MVKVLLLFIFLVCVSLSCLSCSKQAAVEKIFDNNDKVELLFFFTKDSTPESRDTFYANELNRPVSGGYLPREGVQATFGVYQNGYEGFGFRFRDDATQEQRESVKNVLLRSSLVYKVYENVIPTQITDL
jgi:hypothetical protein